MNLGVLAADEHPKLDAVTENFITDPAASAPRTARDSITTRRPRE
jgi:hypothetical protein